VEDVFALAGGEIGIHHHGDHPDGQCPPRGDDRAPLLLLGSTAIFLVMGGDRDAIPSAKTRGSEPLSDRRSTLAGVSSG
jgi:hypothetical protein